MLVRCFVSLLLLAASGLAGGLLAGWPGALAGVVLMAAAGLIWESLRLLRLQAWLRELQMAHREEEPQARLLLSPPVGGILGEISDRVWRLLRTHLRAQQESQSRLQEMLGLLEEIKDPDDHAVVLKYGFIKHLLSHGQDSRLILLVLL